MTGVWIPGLAGLRGSGLQSGYCAGLYRPGEHDPAERRSCVCGSPAWKALEAWPSRVGIVQACAGLRGMALQSGYQCRPMHTWGAWPGGAEIVLVWIPGLVGLKGSGLWSGYCGRPVQAWGAQPSRTETLCVWIAGLAGLGGMAWQSRDSAGLCKPEGMSRWRS
jgi:hypothetical protein